ncbi:hypothetical protein HGRIS_001702 [Hohenbuehelia grisea]|uniref:SET domain-containing protein n=1 Tax=Hohenbuehelia grisea TaxID=104357 RepID=A0ABR3JIU6_9AGAR
MFWTDPSTFHSAQAQADCSEALSWLRGTEVERILRGQVTSLGSMLDDTYAYYGKVAQPIIQQYLKSISSCLSPSVVDFCRAYALVSSRAFFVDAFHGLAMVPIADAFNHSIDNHVHLESDFDVCSICGSLEECPHDHGHRDLDGEIGSTMSSTATNPPSNAPQTEADPFDNYYEMVSTTPIEPNVEVYNTYGDTLANAQLLAHYGFILDGNDHDCCTWSDEELDRVFRQLQLQWSSLIASNSMPIALKYADSALVSSFDKSRLTYHLHKAETTPSSQLYCINADGRISHYIWLRCALASISTTSTSLEELLARAVRVQLDLEAAVEAMQDDDGDEDIWEIGTDAEALLLVHRVAVLVTAICAYRREGAGKPLDPSACDNVNERDLGDILDDTPESMPRTRLALTYVMGELAILSSCQSAWSEVGELTSSLLARS